MFVTTPSSSSSSPSTSSWGKNLIFGRIDQSKGQLLDFFPSDSYSLGEEDNGLIFTPMGTITTKDNTSSSSSSSFLALSPFLILSDDVVLKIFFKLEKDPSDWARLSCVSARFSTLIRNVCCKSKCFLLIPSVLADLLDGGGVGENQPPGGWSSFHKICVCCPGLVHAGVLLENSDFGLEREIGPDERFRSSFNLTSNSNLQLPSSTATSSGSLPVTTEAPSHPPSDCSWSLFDDLYFDTFYDTSESQAATMMDIEKPEPPVTGSNASWEFSRKSKVKNIGGNFDVHLAASAWKFGRDQGNKLLASRFREDRLYICDWPGCIHAREKRNYMLFRGIFKNFKRSRVWRTINDGNRRKIDLDCAFCSCKETWDLQSAFCLRRVFGYHDDGEPVVRAFVCENGHVSGAWTERPLYA